MRCFAYLLQQSMQQPQHPQRLSTSSSSVNKSDIRNANRDPKLHSEMSNKNLSANRMPVIYQKPFIFHCVGQNRAKSSENFVLFGLEAQNLLCGCGDSEGFIFT